MMVSAGHFLLLAFSMMRRAKSVQERKRVSGVVTDTAKSLLVLIFIYSNAQMTIMIEPGDDFCFHVPNITEGQRFEFDYQVTESTGAEGINDITVRINSPTPE